MSTFQLIVIGVIAIFILKMLLDRGVIGRGQNQQQQSPQDQPPTQGHVPSLLSVASLIQYADNAIMQFLTSFLPGYKTIIAAAILVAVAIDIYHPFMPRWLHDLLLLVGLAIGFIALRTHQQSIQHNILLVSQQLKELNKERADNNGSKTTS
jgi:hypothetical protein